MSLCWKLSYVGNCLRSSVNGGPNKIVQLLVTVWRVVIEKGVLNTVIFDAKIPQFYHVLSNILSIMSLRSTIQTVSFISHQKKKKG